MGLRALGSGGALGGVFGLGGGGQSVRVPKELRAVGAQVSFRDVGGCGGVNFDVMKVVCTIVLKPFDSRAFLKHVLGGKSAFPLMHLLWRAVQPREQAFLQLTVSFLPSTKLLE